jgi:hypothetical protein
MRTRSAALYLFFAASTVLWLRLDRAPPNWDDAWYLTNSLVMFDALADGGLPGYVAKFFSILGFKAPLITVLPTPFYLLLGRHWHAAFLVNVASMALLFAALYGLARRWWSERAGLLAIAIAGTMPLLYGLSRWFMVEYTLTAAITAAVWLLSSTEGLKSDRRAIAFGAVCGLGLLLKTTFGLFVLLPFCYAWWRSARGGRTLALAVIPCLLIALPWYLRNARGIIRFALTSGYGAESLASRGGIVSARALREYLHSAAASGLSYYFVGLGAVLFAVALARRPRVPAVLLLWLVPFILFLFSANRDIRLATPVLPAIALLMAGVLDQTIPDGRLLAGMLVFPVVSLCAVSFGIPWRSEDLAYARHYDRRSWPLEETLRAVANRRTGRALVLAASDVARFNANNLELTTVAARLPLRVESTAHESDLRTVLTALDQADFVVFQEGPEREAWIINPHGPEVAGRVRRDPAFREIPFGLRLPDAGNIRIYEQRRGVFLPAGGDVAGEFSITFGGILELSALSVSAEPGQLTVRYRWRAIQSPDRDYWCFTHILNGEGKVVGYLDHKLLKGDPPLRQWQPGDLGVEQAVFRVPDGVGTAGVRLKIGLYDPDSGTRLQVALLEDRAAARFTLADNGSAIQVR